MKLHSHHRAQAYAPAHKSGTSKVQGGQKAPQVKFKRNEDGKLVRLKRVKRKKPSTEASNPNALQGTDRVISTSEMGKPAPVQTKPNLVAPKKARHRTITPGLSNLVTRSTPDPYSRPLTTLETVI